MKTFLLLILFLISVQAATAAIGRSRMTAGTPVPLASLRSLGDVLAAARDAKPGRPVHILVVHGMRATGPGESLALVKAIQKQIGDERLKVSPITKNFLLEPWPRTATVGGQPIWRQESDWKAGQPFVDRYILQGRGGEHVVIDEVNWWPLLFPLKCKMLVLPESRVAGANKKQLELCRLDEWPYHRWIDDDVYREAIETRPPLGGAAAANKYLKQQILDWGMSDAVIAAGPMRTYINATIDAAFDHAAKDSTASEFVVISASLGSFAVLHAFGRGTPGVRAVMDRTYNLYFFANQFALLELARIVDIPDQASHSEPRVEGDKSSVAASPPTIAAAATSHFVSPVSALKAWVSKTAPSDDQTLDADPAHLKQIIAFSDPSDALTFEVPEIGMARVSNVYVRNAVSWLGLFADPLKAHAGHMSNRTIWKAMLRTKDHGAQRSKQ